MTEHSDYNTFRRNTIGPRDRCDRVENLVVVGMPDVNLCIGGVEVWIEFKSPTEPKRSTTPLFGSNHRVSLEQANWMLRQRNAGGRCYLLIATNKRWILINGGLADEVNAMTVDQLSEQSNWMVTKPVGKGAWKHLRRLLSR